MTTPTGTRTATVPALLDGAVDAMNVLALAAFAVAVAGMVLHLAGAAPEETTLAMRTGLVSFMALAVPNLLREQWRRHRNVTTAMEESAMDMTTAGDMRPKTQTVRLTVTYDAYCRIFEAMRTRAELIPGAVVTAISTADVFEERDALEAALREVVERPGDAEDIARAALDGA